MPRPAGLRAAGVEFSDARRIRSASRRPRPGASELAPGRGPAAGQLTRTQAPVKQKGLRGQAARHWLFGLMKRRPSVGCSERRKEIKRRWHRRKQMVQLHKRLEKATVSERGEIARKVRELTPGADKIIANWGLDEVDR